jgi:hypothetical protein
MTLSVVKRPAARRLTSDEVEIARAIRDVTLEIVERRQKHDLDAVVRAVRDVLWGTFLSKVLRDVDERIHAAITHIEDRLDQLETERVAAFATLHDTINTIEARLEQLSEEHLAAFDKMTEIMRELPIPLVNVELPDVAAPDVHVHVPKRGVVKKSIEYDAHSRPHLIVEEEATDSDELSPPTAPTPHDEGDEP